MSVRNLRAILLAGALLMGSVSLRAQSPATESPPPTSSARQDAPIDLTGYWVSIVTQNWRFRMVVPGRGEYSGVPLNLAAKEFADAWNPAADEAAGRQCEAYGAPAIMREPGRLHFSWLDADTLRMDTDSGVQTRLLYFHPTPAQLTAPASRQGLSQARWLLQPAPAGAAVAPGKAPRYGSLETVTTRLLAGLLRKNGLPYSDRSTLTEEWEVNQEPDSVQWLTITTTLDDPVYLQAPDIFNSIFKKERDGSRWDPEPCTLRAG